MRGQTSLLTPAEAAVRLDCTTAWVYERVKRGELDAVAQPGKSPGRTRMYVTETSIRAWEERRAQAVAQAETPDEVYAAEVARFLADMRKRLGWRSGPTAETKARIAALVASCDAA